MRKYPSLVGQEFGFLKVIARAESSPSGQRKWLCECVCKNQVIVFGSNLQRGHTASCGCKKENNLKGQHIGKLDVLERSDRYGSRGNRRVRLWKCQCDCGAITYKSTDTLTNPDISMCQECAQKYAAEKARAEAGFVAGTQLSKIKNIQKESDNMSGARGVYLDKKTGKYRARLRFRGKMYSFGSYANLDDAIKARKRGEEEVYEAFLATLTDGATADNAVVESK